MGGKGRCQRAVISDLMDLYFCVQPHESDWVTTKVSECRSVLAETITSAPEDRQAERETDNQEACIHRRGQRISVERTTNYTDLWVSSAYYLHSPLSPPPRTGNRVVLFCDGECKYSNENCALFFLREEGLTQRSSPKQYTGSNIEIMSIASTQRRTHVYSHNQVNNHTNTPTLWFSHSTNKLNKQTKGGWSGGSSDSRRLRLEKHLFVFQKKKILEQALKDEEKYYPQLCFTLSGDSH